MRGRRSTPRERRDQARLTGHWLRRKDSNLHPRLQRPLSCHWTTPQETGNWSRRLVLPQVRGADLAQPGISRLEALASPPGWSVGRTVRSVCRGDQPWDRTTFSRASAERYDHTSSLVEARMVGSGGLEPPRACARGRWATDYPTTRSTLRLVGSRGFEPRSARSERAASANCATSRITTHISLWFGLRASNPSLRAGNAGCSLHTQAERGPVSITGPSTSVSCQRPRSCEHVHSGNARVSTASKTHRPCDLARDLSRAPGQNKKGLPGDRPRRPGSR